MEYGGGDTYNIWTFKKIIPYERIEYLQNLSDKYGNVTEPAKYNLPEDFPKDTETTVTFVKINDNKTGLVFKEYADFGSIFELAKIGLEECGDKVGRIFFLTSTPLQNCFYNHL